MLLALVGAHALIALDDLDALVEHVKPKVVRQMNYCSPKGVLKIEPVESFFNRCMPERVTRVKGSTLELTLPMLPETNTPHVNVLEQSR